MLHLARLIERRFPGSHPAPFLLGASALALLLGGLLLLRG